MPMNIYISPTLDQRMKAVDALSKERGLGKIKWSAVAQAAFERECVRREGSLSGLPSLESVDVAEIAQRAERGLNDSYRAAYAAALEAAGQMDDDDIYFLGDYDNSPDGFEAETGLSFIDPDHGYPRNDYQCWADNQEARRDDLIGGAIEAARVYAESHSLRFHHERAQKGAMDAFAGVCGRLQEYVMREGH